MTGDGVGAQQSCPEVERTETTTEDRSGSMVVLLESVRTSDNKPSSFLLAGTARQSRSSPEKKKLTAELTPRRKEGNPNLLGGKARGEKN